jgi:hypothetical protein
MAITISREQRDAIYQELVLDLSGVGNIFHALNSDDYGKARQYRRRFEEDMRLLDDLGWGPEQDADEFELTMPNPDLAGALRRLNDSARALLHTHIVEPIEERKYVERALIAQGAYGDVLAQIVGGEETDHEEGARSRPSPPRARPAFGTCRCGAVIRRRLGEGLRLRCEDPEHGGPLAEVAHRRKMLRGVVHAPSLATARAPTRARCSLDHGHRGAPARPA